MLPHPAFLVVVCAGNSVDNETFWKDRKNAGPAVVKSPTLSSTTILSRIDEQEIAFVRKKQRWLTMGCS